MKNGTLSFLAQSSFFSNLTPIWLFYPSKGGFPCGSDGKESACNAGDLGSIPGLGRSLGAGNGNPFQYSCLGNPTDRGDWQATVHGVTKSRTWLSMWWRLLNTLQNIIRTSYRPVNSCVQTPPAFRVYRQIVFPQFQWKLVGYFLALLFSDSLFLISASKWIFTLCKFCSCQ